MARNEFSSTKDMNDDIPSASRIKAEAKGEIKKYSSLASDYLDDVKKSASDQARSIADDAAITMQNAAHDAADALADLSQAARDAATRSFRSLSKEVARNPVSSLALAAGIGLLLGLMTRR